MVTSYLTQTESDPNVVLRTPNLTTALQLASAGLGATIVPASLLAEQTVEADTQIVPLPIPEFQADVAITYKTAAQLNEAATEFFKFGTHNFRIRK